MPFTYARSYYMDPLEACKNCHEYIQPPKTEEPPKIYCTKCGEVLAGQVGKPGKSDLMRADLLGRTRSI